MLVLNEAEVRRFLEMRALIPAMERALRALSAGEVVQPVRVMVPVAEHGGFLGSMPAYAGAQLGAKLVTFYPNNQGRPNASRPRPPLPPRDGGTPRCDGRTTDYRDADRSSIGRCNQIARAPKLIGPRNLRVRCAGTEPPRSVADRARVSRHPSLEPPKCGRVRTPVWSATCAIGRGRRARRRCCRGRHHVTDARLVG